MIGQYTAVIITLIMALVNTISVVAQSQNETNETNIGANQSVSGNISAFGEVRNFGPRTIDDSAMGILELDRTLNETELNQNLNASKY